MSAADDIADPWKDMFDDYLSGILDEEGTRPLEEFLRNDAGGRRYFVRYARLHTDLYLETRAGRAGTRALGQLQQLAGPSSVGAEATGVPVGRRSLMHWWRLRRAVAVAALVLAVGIGCWLLADSSFGRDPAVAWLVNAQNCQWSVAEPTGHMPAKTSLRIVHGLAEIRFQCGARVILEGPAHLELLSARSARLWHGKLTARVPAVASGFEILSPQGKVIDLGTEFGLVVSDKGATDVYVFEGNVEALPMKDGAETAPAVNLTQHQAAQIADGKVVVKDLEANAGAAQFVRAIVAPPVILPRTLHVTFERADLGGLCDRQGFGTGLTHRLPGTGLRLPPRDPNLRLDADKAQLELTTTDSDLNTQYRLNHGEYLGTRLSDLGFTGKEDFAVTTTIVNIPALEFVGQFGLYAGARCDQSIRGGLLSSRRAEPGQYTQFLVNNHVWAGKDVGCDTDTCQVGLFATGADLRITLRRIDGKYSLTVANLTDKSSSTLTTRHPQFLDDHNDLYVGLFGANTQSNVRRTLLFKEFEVTVWTASSGE